MDDDHEPRARLDIHVIDERTAAALDQITSLLQTLIKDSHVMANALDTELATLQASLATLTSAVAANNAILTGIPAQIAAAVAAATAAGATPDELQAVTDLNTALQAQISSLTSADTAAAPGAA